jgi:hypothetical protein
MRLEQIYFKYVDDRNHEGLEEEKEEEKERIVVHNLSRNCSFSGHRNVCWACVSVGGPLLAPTGQLGSSN